MCRANAIKFWTFHICGGKSGTASVAENIENRVLVDAEAAATPHPRLQKANKLHCRGLSSTQMQQWHSSMMRSPAVPDESPGPQVICMLEDCQRSNHILKNGRYSICCCRDHFVKWCDKYHFEPELCEEVQTREKKSAQSALSHSVVTPPTDESY